jgi:hypothetical protein
MRTLKVAVATVFTLAVTVVLADKLSDFKDAARAAASGPGCDTIPYSDLRSTCKSEGSNVHDYCDGGRGPVTCGSESLTRQVKDNLERQRKNVEALKDKKRNVEDQKSRATNDNDKNRLSKEVEQVDREIYDAGKRVDQAGADLDARKKLVDDAIYTLNKCLDYRRAVMNIFATAQDKVRGETDPDIVPLARELRDGYEASKRGHEIAIKDKENALETCKNSRP